MHSSQSALSCKGLGNRSYSETSVPARGTVQPVGLGGLAAAQSNVNAN